MFEHFQPNWLKKYFKIMLNVIIMIESGESE